MMKVYASPAFDTARASFLTHLNYVKRIEHLLNGCSVSVKPSKVGSLRRADITRFIRLYEVTRKSIKKDIELAREDTAFAVISAPWFPVKCYYALYYLESVLVHLMDGAAVGFVKGGHAGVRKKISMHIQSGALDFSVPDLNRSHLVEEIENIPAITGGRNTRGSYWSEDSCTDSLLKKLSDYKLHDAKVGRKWNLRTKTGRADKAIFAAGENVTVLDFFYWYRIKANYRDLDYVDFENGITEREVLEYIETYYKAYGKYRSLIAAEINRRTRAWA